MSSWQCSECGSTDMKRRAKGLCHQCYHGRYIAQRKQDNPAYRAEESRRSYQRNRVKRLAREVERRRALKWEIVERLGGVCACCGETTLEFLTVDHINGDGAAHRRQMLGRSRANSIKIYKDIRNQGFPRDRYRILCFNCNCAIGCWGYCPHTYSRSTKYPVRLVVTSALVAAQNQNRS